MIKQRPAVPEVFSHFKELIASFRNKIIGPCDMHGDISTQTPNPEISLSHIPTTEILIDRIYSINRPPSNKCPPRISAQPESPKSL